MASFYIPLTGLNADSTALNTIANNLANMNTTGYKSKSVSFSDLFYQQIGEAEHVTCVQKPEFGPLGELNQHPRHGRGHR